MPGDGIDNDCDGKIDEEIKDGNDDDNDKLIDEDLQKVLNDFKFFYENWLTHFRYSLA